MTGDTKPRRPGRPAKHPLWTDPSTGEQHTLSGNTPHPNYRVAKNFRDRSMRPGRHYTFGSDEDFQLCERWSADVAAFTYELASEIGFRPSPHHEIKPRDPELPVGPGNCRWEHPGWRDTRRARIAKELQANRLVRLPSGATIAGWVVDALRHKAGCEATHVDPVECWCCSPEVEPREEW